MITIHEADSLTIDVPVTFDAGGPVASLAGATVAATVQKTIRRVASGNAVSASSPSIMGNTITCGWPAGTFTAGLWRLQVQVTIAGQVQTVVDEEMRVLPSNADVQA